MSSTSNTESAVATRQPSTVSTYTRKVTDPIINVGETVGVKTLKWTEDTTLKVVHTVVDTTEEYTEKTFGHEKTEQLKTLGGEAIGIGTNSFHRLGGIADQFSNLVEETAHNLLGVGKAAGDIVTEGTETGAKIRKLVVDTIEKLEDTTQRLTVYVGEGVEDNWTGSRTAEERALLIKDASSGKGTFGLLLTLLAARDGGKNVPRIVELCTSYLIENGSRTKGLFTNPVQETTLHELRKQADENENFDLKDVTDPNLVAALLILFFADLPQPLLMTKNYSKFIAAEVKEEQQEEDMGTLIGDLPLAHRQVLEHMLAFFKRVTVDGDKTRTLANAFGPAWLRAPTGTFNKDNDAANNAVFRIISRQERVLEVAKEFAAQAAERARVAESTSLNRKGAQLFAANNIQGAVDVWNKALALREEVVGRNHKSNADIIGNLAVAHNILGNPKVASDLTARLNVVMRG